MKIARALLRFCFLVGIFFLLRCAAEKPIVVSVGPYRLNSPSSMVLVPSTNLAIVANANVNLDQTTGALEAVDLSTNTVLTNTIFTIPNFAGQIYLDTARKRIYVPDHDEALLIYSYKIPGDNGAAVSFAEVDVPHPLNNDRHYIPYGIETDDIPTSSILVPQTSLGDLILTSTQKGTVSMISAANLETQDQDPDPDYFGLRLYSASNFVNVSSFPGRGASQLMQDPSTGLVYVTSALNNQIYVIDPLNQSIEAMINLDSLALPSLGIRNIAFGPNGIGYVVHNGLNSVIVMDFSGIVKNGIPYEVIDPVVIDVIPVGLSPEDVKLTSNGLTLFVSNQNDDSIFTIDTTLRQVVTKTFLDIGKGPGRLVLDESRNRLYSLDFYSNTISLFDATNGTFVGEIQ